MGSMKDILEYKGGPKFREENVCLGVNRNKAEKIQGKALAELHMMNVMSNGIVVRRQSESEYDGFEVANVSVISNKLLIRNDIFS